MGGTNPPADALSHASPAEACRSAAGLPEAILDSIAEGVAVYDRAWRVVAWNRAIERLTAMPAAEVLGRPILDVVPQRDIPDAAALLERPLRGETLAWPEQPYRVIKTGQSGWAAGRLVPWRDAQGEVCGGILLVRDVSEQKRANQALRFTQFAIDRSGLPAFWMDPDGRFTYVNDAACEALGYSRDELLRMTVFDIDPDTRREDWPARWQRLRERRTVTLEAHQRTRSGRVFPAEVTANYVEFEGHQYNCSFLRDITERREAERREQAFTAGLHAVIAVADELIACPDLDTVHRRAVELARERLGLERCSIFIRDGAEMRGTYGTDDRRRTVDEHHLQFTLEGWLSERPTVLRPFGDHWDVWEDRHSYAGADGAVEVGHGWIAGTPIGTADDLVGAMYNDTALSGAPVDVAQQEVVAIFCSLLANIIKRKQAEDGMREAAAADRRSLAQLVDLSTLAAELASSRSVDELTWRAVDRGRGLLGFDRLSCWFFDPESDTMSGSYGTDESGQTRDERHQRHRLPTAARLHLIQAEKRRWVLSRDTALYDDAGEPVGVGDTAQTALWDGEAVIGSLYADNLRSREPVAERQCELLSLYATIIGHLTTRLRAEAERRRLEGELQQAQRLESLRVLAGGVAHDFNNLMVGVLGNAELLRMTLPACPETAGKLDTIVESACQAGDLAQQMLAFARGGKYQTCAINLNSVVEAVLRLHEGTPRAGVTVERELAPELPAVEGDPTQVQQVVANLCLNAVEALSGLGRVTVRTEEVEVDDPEARRLGGLRPGRYVLLTVTDTGEGMDAETASRVFEPFFSTKRQGRGLGLAAAHGIVRAHGGHIAVQSRPGLGTTLSVYLPAGTEPAAPPANAEEASLPTGSETVLVVDDEAVVREVAQNLLQHLGYRVLLAADGLEAVHVASDHPGEIHVVLLDLDMPVLDGERALPLLREARPDVRVIVCSGYDLDASAQALLAAGACSFIRKPFQASVLAPQVRRALEAPAPPAP